MTRPRNKQKHPDDDDVCINRSGVRLTRAQRRQVAKNTERVDRILDTDRRFFRRFPHRQFRLRLAGQVEIDQWEILSGKALQPPTGFRFFVLVHKLASGIRQRLLAPIQIGSELDDMDLPESSVREIWEMVSTPQLRKIGETVRDMVEGKL